MFLVLVMIAACAPAAPAPAAAARMPETQPAEVVAEPPIAIYRDPGRYVSFPDVKRMLEDARSRPTPIPWAWLTGSVTLVSLAAYAGLYYRRWQRNRFRITPAEVVRLIEESAEPPVILDVRSADTYAQSPLRIPNAIHISPQELQSGVTSTQIQTDRTVVAYCT